MTPREVNRRIDEAFQDPAQIQAAIERGIADAAERYARAGELMASWKDGRVVLVDPVTFEEVESAAESERRRTTLQRSTEGLSSDEF